nr:hypothetical protein BaRGS_007427 [Batillaria attramentaria]
MAAIGSTGEHLFLPECFEVSFADDKIIRGHVQSAREVQETLDAVNKEFNTAFNSWFKKINKEKLGPDAESRLLWYTDLQLQGTTCIVPGLVLQNDVMVCDRGGRPYNPKPTNVQKNTMAIVQGKTACLQNFHKKHADAFRHLYLLGVLYLNVSYLVHQPQRAGGRRLSPADLVGFDYRLYSLFGEDFILGRYRPRDCKPRKNFAFIKCMKCATETLGGVLRRYSYVHNLSVVLPVKTRSTWAGRFHDALRPPPIRPRIQRSH